mgnify:CR=1 FL=1
MNESIFERTHFAAMTQPTFPLARPRKFAPMAPMRMSPLRIAISWNCCLT